MTCLSDIEKDNVIERAIYLRRTAGKARVTICEDGHEDTMTATTR